MSKTTSDSDSSSSSASSLCEAGNKRKRKRSSSSSSSSSSDSDDQKRRKRKERRRIRKEKRRLRKKLKKEKKKMKKAAKKAKRQVKDTEVMKTSTSKVTAALLPGPAPGPPIPELSDRAQAMKPMTKEEWDKRQLVIRKVYDEETGRHRLIKGDGEVLEEIVSRDRHREINRQATKGDGTFFQSQLTAKITR